LLPIAQIVYNNKTLELISKILFFANYGQHLNFFTRIYLSLKIEVVIVIAK
ncbi:hypothetical protein COCSADRAFT_92468, partial [Bipolaris sorokiniana ND90Pr]